MVWSHSPLPVSCHTQTLPYPPDSVSLFVKCFVASLCCPCPLRCVAFLSEGWTSCLPPLSIWDLIFLKRMQVWSMLSQLVFVHLYSCLTASIRQFLYSHLPALALTVFPSSFPNQPLSHRQMRCDTDVPFRAEYSAILFYTPWSAVGLCVNHHLLCR